MPPPSSSDDLWNEAMALLLTWQATPDDASTRAAILDFCAAGPEHKSVWSEACRVFALTGTAVGAKPKPRKRKRRVAVSRRDVLKAAGIIGAGAGVLKGASSWRRWTSDASTHVAEIQSLELPDNSILVLGPDSAVDIAFTPHLRRVTLIEGMVFCDISKDDKRPFVAQTDALSAYSEAGRFELRNNGGRSLAGVEYGRIRLSLITEGEKDFDLGAGDWVAAGSDDRPVEQGRLNTGQTAPWRRNVLIADHEEIGAVVAEMSRWRHGSTLVLQDSLARATVSGYFDLTDSDAALAAVVNPYGGKVRHVSPWITVLSTV